MKLVTFKSETGHIAINPDMVTAVSPHFTKPGMTVIAFAGGETDYAVINEEWPIVIRKLESYTP